jgi:CheY-like chemotaxis protein
MIDLKTILLVEDDSNDIELTIEALSELKLANQVIVARDGVEAMEYLRCEGKFKDRRRENPAVILLDIKMPRMDGIEVLHAIRDDVQLKKIPVVMLTSSREEIDLKKSYEFGTNAFVVKPVDFKEFIYAVKQIGVFWALINELPKD